MERAVSVAVPLPLMTTLTYRVPEALAARARRAGDRAGGAAPGDRRGHGARGARRRVRAQGHPRGDRRGAGGAAPAVRPRGLGGRPLPGAAGRVLPAGPSARGDAREPRHGAPAHAPLAVAQDDPARAPARRPVAPSPTLAPGWARSRARLVWRLRREGVVAMDQDLARAGFRHVQTAELSRSPSARRGEGAGRQQVVERLSAAGSARPWPSWSATGPPCARRCSAWRRSEWCGSAAARGAARRWASGPFRGRGHSVPPRTRHAPRADVDAVHRGPRLRRPSCSTGSRGAGRPRSTSGPPSAPWPWAAPSSCCCPRSRSPPS